MIKIQVNENDFHVCCSNIQVEMRKIAVDQLCRFQPPSSRDSAECDVISEIQNGGRGEDFCDIRELSISDLDHDDNNDVIRNVTDINNDQQLQ